MKSNENEDKERERGQGLESREKQYIQSTMVLSYKDFG